MKTIVEINGGNYASTGNIAINITQEAIKNGYNAHLLCSISRESKKHYADNQVLFGNWIDRVISEKLSYITGLRDHFNIFQTHDLIKKIDELQPDLIHLHVLHDNFINFRMLFNHLEKINIPVIWTFHDCSSFTGQCPYFDMVECEKWKNGCYKCEQLHIEPKSLFFDTSRSMWKYKKKYFTKINNLTIVTPSIWLSQLVKNSFFKNKTIKVINNGIDLNVYKPIESDFKKEHNIENKYIVLGVANYWGKRKGLDVFIKLAAVLPNNYQIILVGTNDEIDKQLPKNIISIHRTYNKEELVKIYSCANVFANPTREDNFPTVNIEALACGIPVVTFKTGGSPEILDESCGSIVEKNDFYSFKNEIMRICEKTPYKKEACISRSKNYDKQNAFKKYIDLFNEILHNSISIKKK